MLMKFWQTAILAAIVSLTGTVVWAQTPYPLEGVTGSISVGSVTATKCGDAKDCCATGACCKDAKCAKTTCATCASCAGCCKACAECSKVSKCQCGKGEKCCCEKNCECGKVQDCCKASGCCCATHATATKSTTIVVVMPAVPPCLGYHETMGMMPPPPMPPMLAGLPPHGAPVPMLPPPPGCLAYTCPAMPCPACACTIGAPIQMELHKEACMEDCSKCLNVLHGLYCAAHPASLPSLCTSAARMACTMNEGCCSKSQPCCAGSACQAAPTALTLPQPLAGPIYGCPAMTASMQPVLACSVNKPEIESKISIVAPSNSDQLEMSLGDDTCVNSKKMTVKLCGKTLTLSRFEDRVRVRGDELKATAERVRTDRKDCLILEGEGTLYIKKQGNRGPNSISGDRIELNLSTGAYSVRSSAK